jgi:N-glycosylase/DNA lyase
MKIKLKLVSYFKLTGLPPFNFELTVHKPRYGYWLTPFEIYKGGKIWSGMRLSDGTPIGVKLQSTGGLFDPKIAVSVFCTRELKEGERGKIKKKISKLLQIGEDISEFYSMCDRYPALKKAKKDLYGMRDTHFPDLFNGLLLALTLQMTPWERSLRMLESLYLIYGERIRFDEHEVIISPSPATIAEVKEEELRERCKIGYRAKYLKEIARSLIAGFPSLEELERLSPPEAKQKLKKLKGIGEYSADIVTPHPSFPVDIWNVKIFSKAFGLKTERIKNSIDFVKQYAGKEFGKWQRYVYAYILHDLNNLKSLLGDINSKKVRKDERN